MAREYLVTLVNPYTRLPQATIVLYNSPEDADAAFDGDDVQFVEALSTDYDHTEDKYEYV